MEPSASLPKIDVLEKALEFQFLLLLLCYITFTNSFFIITSNTDILHITEAVLKDKISIGIIIIGFAMFSFIMSVVVKPLRGFIVLLVGRYVESFLNAMTSEGNKSYAIDPDYKSEDQTIRLAVKHNDRYLLKLLDSNNSMRSKLDQGAALAFTLWVLLIIDLFVSLSHGDHNLSLVKIVGSMAKQLPEFASGLVQLILWVFSTVVFIYSLHPRTGDYYIFIPSDIVKLIEERSSDKQ